MRSPAPDHTHCNGTVVVHEDRSFTCTSEACPVAAMVAAVVSYHTRFVPCRSAFAEHGCPRCSGGAPGPVIGGRT